MTLNLEGLIRGGGETNWEIKFNHKQKIFNKLKATISKAEDKDLLNGKAKMLETYKLAVSKSIVSSASVIESISTDLDETTTVMMFKR